MKGMPQVGLGRTWGFVKKTSFIWGHDEFKTSPTKLNCLVGSWKDGSRVTEMWMGGRVLHILRESLWGGGHSQKRTCSSPCPHGAYLRFSLVVKDESF